jgi:hypothetical protein
MKKNFGSGVVSYPTSFMILGLADYCTDSAAPAKIKIAADDLHK